MQSYLFSKVVLSRYLLYKHQLIQCLKSAHTGKIRPQIILLQESLTVCFPVSCHQSAADPGGGDHLTELDLFNNSPLPQGCSGPLWYLTISLIYWSKKSSPLLRLHYKCNCSLVSLWSFRWCLRSLWGVKIQPSLHSFVLTVTWDSVRLREVQSSYAHQWWKKALGNAWTKDKSQSF